MPLEDYGIHVAIKSYKRSGNVKTAACMPFASIWVPESQAEAYRANYGERVIAIPDDRDGNLCRKQNAILDLCQYPKIVILDDDIPRVGMWENGGHKWLSPADLEWFIWQAFVMADDLGVSLWGINQGKDEMNYHPRTPFSLLTPVLGPFHGHIKPKVRYDESVLGKDDYDFWLQTIKAEHKTLRFNKYHYVHDHGKGAGGFVSQRTMDIERQGVERMRQKWGDKVFRPGGSAGGKSATGQNILNSRIHIPIEGC